MINGPSENITLSYDANNQRWKQVYVNGATTETTMYAGRLFEKVTTGSVIDYRHYIYAGNELVGVLSRSGTSVTLRYTLSDHQGSMDKITDSSGSGAVTVSENFNAFGVRRNASTWSGSPTSTDLTTVNGISRQGYTGQDALGNLGLNHMNGRVQDAVTGRFLSADPYIPEPASTQSFNRYSYVRNNPLSFTDPSGFLDCSDDAQDQICSSDPGSNGDVSWGPWEEDDDDGTGADADTGVPSDAGSWIFAEPASSSNRSGSNTLNDTTPVKTAVRPQSQNAMPDKCTRDTTWSKVANTLSDISDKSQYVAIASGGAALLTSETVVGELGLERLPPELSLFLQLQRVRPLFRTLWIVILTVLYLYSLQQL